MKATDLTPGQRVKNQYGETLTVLEVIGNSVKTREEPNTLYHCSKLFVEQPKQTT